MARAGVADDVIISQIIGSHTVFHLSAAEIIDLHNSGVSDRVVNYMINARHRQRQLRPQPPPSWREHRRHRHRRRKQWLSRPARVTCGLPANGCGMADGFGWAVIGRIRRNHMPSGSAVIGGETITAGTGRRGIGGNLLCDGRRTSTGHQCHPENQSGQGGQSHRYAQTGKIPEGNAYLHFPRLLNDDDVGHAANDDQTSAETVGQGRRI